MAEAGPAKPPAADLEAAIAALPIKKEALRETFECLTACSPYPLPFTWEGLDAHISGIQSSISRRYRQLQVLDAAQPARAVPALVTTRTSDSQQQKQEEVEEEEEEEEEVVEEGEENDDGEDEEGEESEGEEEEEEIEEEVIEEEVVEEEVLEKAEDATSDEGKQEADEEMQLINEGDKNSKAKPEARGKVEEQNADEVLPDKNEVEGVHQEGKEEQEEERQLPYVEPGTKNAEVSLKEDMIQKQVQRAPASGSKDLMAVCGSMDANTLVKFIGCSRTALGKELPIAMRHTPDAAALALQVIKLFLSSKKFKTTKVWNNCVSLLRCVPVAASKPSVDTIEQAKQVAKDWKEIIYKLECPGDLELLSARGLLYFLMSYNIVSEFDTSEIFRLFSMIPRHMQKKNTMELCKGLGIAHRITDLIDYLIGKGQQLEVFHLAHVFNLSDKYPLLFLLKGYIETAKQTSMEIQSKSLNSAIPKEIENLWVAHHLAKQKITDSSQRGALMAEIKTLLDGYAMMKKKRLAKACTSNIQTQLKKCKKEEQELLKGQESLQQDQQSKAQEQGLRQNSAQQKQ